MIDCAKIVVLKKNKKKLVWLWCVGIVLDLDGQCSKLGENVLLLLV